MDLGGGFVGLMVWRGMRNRFYVLTGLVRPGWHRAFIFVIALDRYADKATFAMVIYGDPRFAGNMRALERELRRVRRGGKPRDFEMPHDSPPGARESVRAVLTGENR